MDDTPKHWNQGSFGAGVKIGNWNEDTYLKEEELADFLLRNANSDLGFHKTDALLKLSKAPSNVSVAGDGNVVFGSQFMLINPTSNTALSSLPSIHVGVHEKTDEKLMITASGMGENDAHMPAKRNVFTIVPYVAETQAEGQPVCFADKFHIRCEHPTNPGAHLYLYSETPTVDAPVSRITKQQVVSLKPTNGGLNAYGTVWTIMLQDPNYRLESEQTPVPANVEICIKHSQSGQCLSCNYKAKKIVSEFGAESEVTAKTNMKREKVESEENHWVLAMQA